MTTQQQLELKEIENLVTSHLSKFFKTGRIDIESSEKVLTLLKKYNLKWYGTENPNAK